MIWSVVATVFLCLGALNTVLARVAGTCTQGDAERLWGTVISILLYAIGALALSRARPSPFWWVAALPLLAVLAWQTAFGLRFADGVFLLGETACDVLEGEPLMYEPSGHETAFASLWLALALGVPLILFLAGRAAMQRHASK